MKIFVRLVVFVLIIAASILVLRKYRSAPALPAPTVTAPTDAVLNGPNLSPRTWVDQNGRSFEGSLVSARNGQVIIRRASDSAYFQIPTTTLASDDQTFIQEQMNLAQQNGGFVEQIPDHYTLSRKLEIKGYLMRVPAPELVGGWQQERIDPKYFLLLSTQVHGADSGSLWVPVDERTFRAHNEGGLISENHLSGSSDGGKGGPDRLPWPRPQLTLVEAQYGPHAQGINVTHKLMSMASRGDLPVDIKPELFGLPSHTPAAWELLVVWRSATGEIRRTLRDGSTLAWP